MAGTVKIVGHRGAAGVKLENTASAIKAGLYAQVDAIEIDIRKSVDGEIVLSHDPATDRLSGQTVLIKDTTFADLQKLKLYGDERIINLPTALRLIPTSMPVFIDIKDPPSLRTMLRVIDAFDDHVITLTGRQYDFMKAVHDERPTIKFHVQAHSDPFEIIQTAKHLGASGITLNAWILNPWTYWRVKRAGLSIMIYTVNRSFIARFIKYFYPDVWVCSDFPRKLTKMR